MHCMPQSATLTHFRSPVPAISEFDLFGFRPEILKNFQKPSKLQLQKFGLKNYVHIFLVYQCFDLI